MESAILTAKKFSAGFNKTAVLKDINLDIFKNKATAIMGPSGCGKTTLMRCMNRMHEMVSCAFAEGEMFLDNENIYRMDPIALRRKTGMVFQRPNPFPTMSIFDNVISGYLLNGIRLPRDEKHKIVEDALRKAALWE